MVEEKHEGGAESAPPGKIGLSYVNFLLIGMILSVVPSVALFIAVTICNCFLDTS